MRLLSLPSIYLFLFLTALCSVAQDPQRFTFLEKQGPDAVGLKVLNLYDYSRMFQPLIDELGKPFEGERARPLQTLVWYPADRSKSKPMTVGDYVALKATETSFQRPQSSTGLEEWLMAGMKTNLATPLWAVRDAPVASGRFPVVIYAPSFSSVSWENVDLCEYLASYGYVVIASPGMGVAHDSTHDVAGTNAQARDLSFLIGYAQTLADTDMSKVAVLGFSWGGLSGLFAAARDNRVDALIALDGSMRYFPGVVKQSGDVHPEEMTIPLLFFKGQSSLEDQDRLESSFKSDGPNVLNAWTHGDLISVDMPGLVHPEFSSMAHRNEKLWQYEFAGLQKADYGREDGMIGYGWVSRYTREFLDAYLKQDASALKYLQNKPSGNGVPTHTMAVNFRPAQKLPMSLTSFRVEVGRQGFDHASEVYARFQKGAPALKLDADAVSSWAYELLANRHIAEAIDVMKLSLQLEPSSRAYASLGEMYGKAGEKQLAIESYKKALEKDGYNIVARQSLAELGDKSTPTK